MLPFTLVVVFVIVAWLFKCLNVMREYERGVVFRLGRVLKHEKGPGLVLILWPIDKIVKVSLRVVTWDVPPQDVITRDNVSLKVNAVVYFQVVSATKAVIESRAIATRWNRPRRPVCDRCSVKWSSTISSHSVRS